MDNSYLQVANEFGLWVIALFMVSIVIVQALVFMKKAFKTGRNIGMTEEQLKSGLRSGIITSIGPSFAVLIGLVALMALVGAPMAWMRLSVIGAVMFETMAANAGAVALGTKIGEAGYGLVGFTNSLWVMALGSVGWLVVAGISAPKLDELRKAIVRGKEDMLPVITIGAILGAFGYQFSGTLVTLGKPAIASIVSASSMMLFNAAGNKPGLRWLKEWSLGFAMVIGMFAAVII